MKQQQQQEQDNVPAPTKQSGIYNKGSVKADPPDRAPFRPSDSHPLSTFPVETLVWQWYDFTRIPKPTNQRQIPTSEFSPDMVEEFNQLQSQIDQVDQDHCLDLTALISHRALGVFFECVKLESQYQLFSSLLKKYYNLIKVETGNLLNIGDRNAVLEIFKIFQHIGVLYNMLLIEKDLTNLHQEWKSMNTIILYWYKPEPEVTVVHIPAEVVYSAMPMAAFTPPIPIEKISLPALSPAIPTIVSVLHVLNLDVCENLEKVSEAISQITLFQPLAEKKTQYIKLSFKTAMNKDDPARNVIFNGLVAGLLLSATAAFANANTDFEVLRIFTNALANKRVVSVASSTEFSLVVQTAMLWSETSARFVNILCCLSARLLAELCNSKYPDNQFLQSIVTNSGFVITPVFYDAYIPEDPLCIATVSQIMSNITPLEFWADCIIDLQKLIVEKSPSIDEIRSYFAQSENKSWIMFADGFQGNLDDLDNLAYKLTDFSQDPLPVEIDLVFIESLYKELHPNLGVLPSIFCDPILFFKAAAGNGGELDEQLHCLTH
jgi:hypothetical protein